MSRRSLLLIPLAAVLALTAVAITDHEPTRVAPLTQSCPGCNTTHLPWLWAPWPMPLLIPLPTPWQVVATGDQPERSPTRVAHVVPPCDACSMPSPWPLIWIPWLPVPVPVQWQVG